MIMYCASLKSQALNAIICHLCAESSDKICKRLTNSLNQNGIYEIFARLVFQKMVEKYPSLVSDQLLDMCCHGNLKEINIKNCTNVSLHAVNAAVARCTNLTALDISECDQLLDVDLIRSLEKSAKQLRSLKFDGCSRFTHKTLEMTLQRLPHLTEISCEGCENLSNISFLKSPDFNMSASALTTVNLAGCREINCTFIRHLTAFTHSNLQSLNISGTSIDCIALVYLSGYSLSSAVTIATNLNNSKTKDLLIFKSKEDNQLDITEGKSVVDNNYLDVFDEDLDRVETLSNYMKKVCAYCSNDLAVRKSSECIDSIKFFSITVSYEDYDIVDSQILNIFETNQIPTDDVPECKKDEDLEWAVLSINDICIENVQKCTCTSDASDTEEDLHLLTPNENNDNVDDQKGLTCEQIFVPNITSLDVSNTNFYDTGFYHIDVVRECFHLFLNSNKNLKSFHMSWASDEVTDDMISLIADRQVDMENISLAGCVRVSNIGLSDLVKKLHKLKAIDLAGVSFVTDEPLLQLVRKHTELQYLSLAESCLTDKVLTQISSTLAHSVRHLDLSWCENIRDKGVTNLLSCCKKLTYLDLRQCEITGDTISSITENGKMLSAIGLSGMKGLNDSTCTEMVKNLPNLRRVDLSWNSSLTDESISVLCQSCPCLREIIISGLKRITSKPFLPIISDLLKWRQTREKIISRLYTQMLPNTYINVRERDVSNFEALEPDFYLPFRSVNYIPELRKLTLGYCDKVNDNHLSEIVAVSRGTLMIEDYYGAAIKAKWSDLPENNKNFPLECNSFYGISMLEES